MPAYNFQKQFVPMILKGIKHTTIRRKRKYATEAGDLIYIFIGLRTSSCIKIAEARIVDVSPIIIYPFEFRTKLDGVFVSPALDLRNAQKDGFPDLTSYYRFFQRYKRDVLDDFEVITWDPDTLKSWVIREEWLAEKEGAS